MIESQCYGKLHDETDEGCQACLVNDNCRGNWYIVQILMPDNFFYLEVTNKKPEIHPTSGYSTESQAQHMAELYSAMYGVRMMKDYKGGK